MHNKRKKRVIFRTIFNDVVNFVPNFLITVYKSTYAFGHWNCINTIFLAYEWIYCTDIIIWTERFLWVRSVLLTNISRSVSFSIGNTKWCSGKRIVQMLKRHSELAKRNWFGNRGDFACICSSWHTLHYRVWITNSSSMALRLIN